jgi:hypothetical protein
MPAKMFPHLKLLCWLFMGPTLGFDTMQRNSFLIKFGVFYHKSKILIILFIVKYEKITLFDEFLALLGPIISRFFACSNEEKKGACSSPISMLFTLNMNDEEKVFKHIVSDQEVHQSISKASVRQRLSR